MFRWRIGRRKWYQIFFLPTHTLLDKRELTIRSEGNERGKTLIKGTLYLYWNCKRDKQINGRSVKGFFSLQWGGIRELPTEKGAGSIRPSCTLIYRYWLPCFYFKWIKLMPLLNNSNTGEFIKEIYGRLMAFISPWFFPLLLRTDCIKVLSFTKSEILIFLNGIHLINCL